MPDLTPDPLWTLDDIAAYFACSRRTVERLVTRDDFPGRLRLAGRVHRWAPEQVRHWARSQQETDQRTRLVDALR